MATPARERGGEGKGTSPIKQYYVEVLREDKRLHMLSEMVHVLKQYAPFGMAVVCSGRDTLDSIIVGLSHLAGMQVHVLHGDLQEWERAHVMACFRQGLALAAQPPEEEAPPPADTPAPPRDYVAEVLYGRSPPTRPDPIPPPETSPPPPKKEPLTAQVLVATDVAARGIELPPQVGLLTSYDLPPKKELHTRRLALLPRRTGNPRHVVHFCVTSQSADFKTLEGFAQPARIEDLSVPLSDLVVPLR